MAQQRERAVVAGVKGRQLTDEERRAIDEEESAEGEL